LKLTASSAIFAFEPAVQVIATEEIPASSEPAPWRLFTPSTVFVSQRSVWPAPAV